MLTRTIKYIILGMAFCFCHLILLAQNKNIDSLLTLLKTSKPDTNQVNHLNKLSREFINIGEYDSGLKYGNKALALARSLPESYSDSKGRSVRGWAKGIASAYNNIGLIYYYQGNYSTALKNHFSALRIRMDIKDRFGIASLYNNIGMVYWKQGRYPEALKNYFTALKIREEILDKKGIAASYNNIGLIYWNQGSYPEALKNYFAALKEFEEIGNKQSISLAHINIGNIYFSQANYPEGLKNFNAALKISEEIGDKLGIAMAYNDIGVSYTNLGDYSLALKNYSSALKIYEEIKGKQGIAESYNNIGATYKYIGNYSEALKNYSSSLKINEEISDKRSIAASFVNLSDIQIKLHKLKEAQNYLNKALQLSSEVGYKEAIKLSYSGLSLIDSIQGNWKAAYQHHKLFIVYRDSIDNEETKKKTIESTLTYKFEKQELQTKGEQDKKDAITAEEKQRQKIILLFVVCGLVLVMIFAGFIFKGYKQKQKANIIITQQKAEVEKQKELVEVKNKEITDSINYAKRIQQAKLPKKEEICSALPQSFVLFKPKDIVSGDFYFFSKNHKHIFIAAADCTGHGVPGAFMSMIGSEKLEDAVSQTTDTSEILKLLNKGIKTSLHQSEINESTRDGMDIALCSVDTIRRIIRYAGANRPIWLIRKGQSEVEEIKATKKAIGGFTEDNQHFETHEIKLQQGGTFYIFTDGYADQFGGEEGKKLMTKKFKEILLDIQDKTMQEQEKYLDTFANNWRGNREQIDDILVIGVRL